MTSDKHPVTAGGIRFESRRQADHFLELKALERAGKITELEVNKRLHLDVEGVRISTFKATFSYKRDGKLVLMDCDRPTDVSRVKHRLVRAILGTEVQDGY